MIYQIKPIDADYLSTQSKKGMWLLIAPDGRVWIKPIGDIKLLVDDVVCSVTRDKLDN
jgi:hypothetical protein